MLILRCGLLLSILSYQLLAFTAVAQNACLFSSTKTGTCKPYADCMEIHGQMLFQNAACKGHTYCCPNNLITPPLSDIINNPEPNEYTNYEDVNVDKIWNLFNPKPENTNHEDVQAPFSGPNVEIAQPNPNFNNFWNTKPSSAPEVQKNPNINYPRYEDELINPSIYLPEIPIDTVEPNINDPKDEEDAYFNPPVIDTGIEVEVPANPVEPNINDPQDEEDAYFNPPAIDTGVEVEFPANPVEPNINDPEDEEDAYFNPPVIDHPDINDPEDEEERYFKDPTTPKPITTTTEAIPYFDKEFYRRLGLAFGNKYNRYPHQPVGTPENSTENKTEIIIITEEITTNSTDFMKKLNPLGLHKLSSEKCGFVHFQNDPSVSNTEAHLLELPWLALLRYTGEAKNINFSCGGSLITERWVLTAASCIKKSLIGVRLGEYEISEKSKKDCVQRTCTEYKDFKIASTVEHPQYKPETGIKDIALIKLKERAKKSKSIKTICLPTKPEYFNVPYDNTSLTISGWGLNKEGATKVMKKHALNRSKIQACHQANPKGLCLATVNEKSSTCSGDPGGPVSWIVDDSTQFVTQIGVVPFGMDKCGATDGVVSNYYVESVADSMDWITKVIGGDV